LAILRNNKNNHIEFLNTNKKTRLTNGCWDNKPELPRLKQNTNNEQNTLEKVILIEINSRKARIGGAHNGVEQQDLL